MKNLSPKMVLEQYRRDLFADPSFSKDSFGALELLLVATETLYSTHPTEIINTLSSWMLSADDAYRFDAMFLTRKIHIIEMLPSLYVLKMRLKDNTTGLDNSELQKINQLIDALRGQEHDHLP